MASREGKVILVLARSQRRAHEIARMRGLPAKLVAWPRTLDDLTAWYDLPLYVDHSLDSHPNALALAEFVAARVAATQPPWRGRPRSLHDRQ
jgi:hypothetical protein